MSEEEPQQGGNAALKLAIHELVDSSQSEHGLRDAMMTGSVLEEEAYRTYRQYCGRRCRRARKAVKLVQGKGKNFTKQEVSLENGPVTAAHLALVVTLAERNWAHSVELKLYGAQSGRRGKKSAMSNKEEDDDAVMEEKRGAVARRARGRMAVAAQYAAKLAELCKAAGADELTKLESVAYECWLSGLALEPREPVKALEKLNSARRIYAELATVGSARSQDVFAKRSELAENASRRAEYAAKLAGGGGSMIEEEPKMTLSDSMRKLEVGSGRPSTKWCGQEIELPVSASAKLETRLKTAQLFGGDDDASLSEAAYSKRIGQLEDCARAIGEESKKHCGLTLGVGEKVEAQRRAYEMLRAKSLYLKLELISKRTETAVKTADESWRRCCLASLGADLENKQHSGQQKALLGDLVHLYDQLMQVTAETSQLAGISEGLDDALSELLECRAAKLKALRCYYLAEVYALTSEKKKVAALREHCLNLAQRATLEAEACDDDQTAREMAKLTDDAKGQRVRLIALASLKATGESSPAASEEAGWARPLMERLRSVESYGADASPPFGIANVPPRPTPIPAKPLLFDIAFNHLEFPNLEERAGIAKPQESRGLFGWFRRS